MANDRLRSLLQDVHASLEDQPNLDEETLRLVQELDRDIHRLVASGGASPAEYDSVLEQAQVLETRFAAEHPIAERFFREIIDVLAKVGI